MKSKIIKNELNIIPETEEEEKICQYINQITHQYEDDNWEVLVFYDYITDLPED